MPFSFKTEQGVTIAALSGTLENSLGQELATRVEQEIPRGGRLIVDGTELKTLTQQGVLHLMEVQRWISSSGRRRLLLAGFSPTVWRAIVENGSDFFFDAKPSVAEALATFGPAAAASVPVNETFAPTPPAPEPPRPPTPPAPEPWISTPAAARPPARPAPPPPEPSVWPTAPTASVEPPRRSSGRWLLWLLVALVLVAAGVGVWWSLGSHPPTLSLSVPSVTVEEDGRETDEVTVTVRHGRLADESDDGLPKGLYFEPPADGSGEGAYILRGRAERGTKTATVPLQAVNEKGERSVPAPFTINVKEKPMAWQLAILQSLGLRVGKKIWTESKFLVNAENVTARRGLPPGLTIEAVPGKKDWQLAGTPTAAGSFQVVFAATAPGGKTEERPCTLEVAPDPNATPPPTPTPPPDASPTPTPVRTPLPTPPPAVTNLDDGMRRFLLERIEHLPADRYTDLDRENLRAVVGTLRQARLIARVVFERDGQTNLSPEQAERFKAALANADNAALLRDPNCQVVVVGYASQTGSIASNVRLSKLRAKAVNDLLGSVTGHSADLCGDYGPTDVVDRSNGERNRAVEVYAGILEPSGDMQADAERFKQDFNRTHGIH